MRLGSIASFVIMTSLPLTDGEASFADLARKSCVVRGEELHEEVAILA